MSESLGTRAMRTLPATNRRRLAACVAAALALSAPALYANSSFVSNCFDSGVGSLRTAVLTAGSGDTVDASGLTTSSPGCTKSTITLKTGDIVVQQDNLTIAGPGMDKLTVTAKYSGVGLHQYQNRIFTHNGRGTLTLQGLTMNWGMQYDANYAIGGCLYSKGSVVLNHALADSCHARSPTQAIAGAIFARQGVSLVSSTVSASSTYAPKSGAGAISARNGFYAAYSTIRNNRALGPSAAYTYTGGVALFGNLTLRASAIVGNYASSIGGLSFYNSGVYRDSIVDSTISGNSAKTGTIGGVYANSRGPVIIENSTIAFNTAAKGKGPAGSAAFFGVGLAVSPFAQLELESTLIANNTYGSTDSDLTAPADVTISGGNNLVRAASASLPSDTLIGKCPLLGPLRDNGGPTLTHALLSHSPGIAQGNGVAGLRFDQRGAPFKRLSAAAPGGSAAAAPDIGAYELQQDDIVFDTGFEGCP